MKLYTVYVCGTCYKESRNRDEILLCEARHMKLETLEEYCEWQRLGKEVSRHGAACSVTKNEETEAAFDAAIEAQLAFERKHRMTVSS